MYIEGFVTPVPAANKQAFTDQAFRAAEMFRKYGALRSVESWGEDVPAGMTTDFRMAVKATPDEVVVFSWVEWPSKEVRDSAYRRMEEEGAAMADMPFDAARMIYGGFVPLVDL